MRIRTAYSFKAAAGKIEDVMGRLVECGYEAAPITDRNSTFGYVRWDKLAKKKKLKPIFGIEIAVVEDLAAPKPILDYWTFVAIEEIKQLNILFETARIKGKLVALQKRLLQDQPSLLIHEQGAVYSP